MNGGSAETPQAPGRTPRQRCPGAEDQPPEASEVLALRASGTTHREETERSART